ncbi:MAG: hypothetical protein ACW99G_01160 [Candidatus Thorarchaeota archaeon]|jgi:hypothetical protein
MPTTSGSITAVSQNIDHLNIDINQGITIALRGTYTDIEVFFEASPDGTNFYEVAFTESGSLRNVSSSGIISSESRIYTGVLQSTTINTLRVRSVQYGSGTMTVEITSSPTTTLADPISGGAWTGQQLKSDSLPVTLASDQNPVHTEGSVAHDDVDADNPMKIGGKARTTNPTAVSDGDRVDATFDDIGRQVIAPHGARDLIVKQYTNINSTTETTILTAGGAGVFNDIITLVVDTDSNNVVITIRDSTGGSTVWVSHLANAGQTVVIDFGSPLIQATANNNWTMQSSKGSANVEVLVQAVQNV